MRFIAAAGRKLLEVNEVILAMVESDATVKSVGGKAGQLITFLTTASESVLFL